MNSEESRSLTPGGGAAARFPRFLASARSQRWSAIAVLLVGLTATLILTRSYEDLRAAERVAAVDRAVALLQERARQQLAITLAATTLLPQISGIDARNVPRSLDTRLLRETSLLFAIREYAAGRPVLTHYAVDGAAPASGNRAAATEARSRALLEPGESPRARAVLLDEPSQPVDSLLVLPVGGDRVVVAELQLAEALDDWARELARGITVRVVAGDRLLYATGEFGDSTEETNTVTLDLAGLDLSLQLRPNASGSLASYSFSRQLLLAMGGVAAVLLAGLVYAVGGEARRAQELAGQLEDNLLKYTEAFRSAPTPLVVFDDQGRIRQASDTWCRASGFAREDLESIDDWLERTRARSEDDEELNRTDLFREYSGFIALTDGQGQDRFWQVATALLHAGDSGRIDYVLIGNDITAARTARLELERSNAELDAFAYVASHDLRSPLRAIKSLATWIMEDCSDELPPAARDDLEALLQRVDRMELLLTDLLAYSRVGREEERARDVRVGEVLADVQASLDFEHGATLEIHGELPVLHAPPTAVRGVFGNLVENALKHGGRDDLTVSVSARREGNWWRFLIDDNGCGIPKEFREKVFGMFERLKSRDEVEGSGMGLALVRKRVEQYGGTIEATESPSSGTRMVIHWPA